MKCISIQQMGIILDVLYRNYSKASIDQVSISNLATHVAVSYSTVQKVRKILSGLKLLIVEGERRSQKCYWNPQKSSPNPQMLTHIYRIFYEDALNSVVKVKKKKGCFSSVESALLTFAKRGAVEVTIKYVDGNKTTWESYKLSTMGERESDLSPF